jgi:hypothetical protein
MTPNQEQLRQRAEDLRLKHAQDLLFSYCDTDIATEWVVKMHKNNASVKDYVMALAEGLKYDNWPWITHSTTRALLNQPSTIIIDSGGE